MAFMKQISFLHGSNYSGSWRIFTFLIQSQQNPVDSVIMIIRMLIQDFIYFLKQNLPCLWLVPVSFPLVKACFADRKNFAKFFYWIIFLKLTFKILLLKLLTAPKIRFVFPFALRFFFFASQLMCCKQCRVAQLPFLLQFHQTTTNCLFSEFFCVLWHTSPSLSVFLALHFYDNSSVLIILIGVVISIIASSRSGNKNYSGYHGGILGSFIGKK